MASYVLAPNRGLRLVQIRSPGVLPEERVVFRVERATNLIQYAVLNARAGTNQVFDRNEFAFWFPSQTVSVGEYVRLYSGAGTNTSRFGNYGNDRVRFHDFYWQKQRPVWTGESSAAVLIEIAEWSFCRVGDDSR